MNLKEDQKRYKVFLDESYKIETELGKEKNKWLYFELKGKYGALYPYSKVDFALLVTSPVIFKRLKRQNRWKILQNGDMEAVFLLPNTDWEVGAEIIKAKKQRIVTSEFARQAAQRFEKWKRENSNDR